MPLVEFYRWFDGAPKHRTGIRVMQCAIAVALVIRCFTEIPFASWLFGPTGIADGQASTAIWGPLAAVLDLPFRSNAGVLVLFIVQLAAALALLVGAATRVATAVLLFTVLAFESRFPDITDGGDNLARLALIYMLLLLPARSTAAPGSVRAWAHNLGVATLIGQVLIVYLTAGIMKAQGQTWMQGTALYMVSQVEWISLPWMREMFKHSIIAVPAAYLTVVWQIMFPIGVFSRFKYAFLAVGAMFHLGILVFMGLTTFCLVMMGAEAFLLSDEDFAELRRWVSRQAVWIRAMTPRGLLRLGRVAP